MGSPTKYTDVEKRKILRLAKGKGDKVAAKKFGVTIRTLRNWRKKLSPGNRRKEGRNEDGTFQPGVSGNPAGVSSARQRARTRYAELSEEVAKAYGEELQAMLERPAGQRDWAKLLELGELINDRGLGRPTQHQELGGPGGRPLAIASTADLIAQHYGVRPDQGPDIDADLEAAGDG